MDTCAHARAAPHILGPQAWESECSPSPRVRAIIRSQKEIRFQLEEEMEEQVWEAMERTANLLTNEVMGK